jgi:3',5'-cyclic-nucleotide phosphodiesterase
MTKRPLSQHTKLIALCLIITLSSLSAWAKGFQLVTLGAKGGIQDGNLTAFLLRAEGQQSYVSLDAGSLVSGLIKAEARGAFDQVKLSINHELTKVGYVLREHIKGYLISHPHLDHVAGLIISSPDDSPKPIYALAQTNEVLTKHIFNWKMWPNFGDRGAGYQLKQYHYTDLTPHAWVELRSVGLQVLALPLSHAGVSSTAFLLKNSMGEVFAYFGDTGADEVEGSTRLMKAWGLIAPYVKRGALKGLIIEVSYANDRPKKQLFGHLTPQLLISELKRLEELAGRGSLKDLPVVISHIKYSLRRADPAKQLKQELAEGNTLGLTLIYPEQGEHMWF